jgi:hypothetical protein
MILRLESEMNFSVRCGGGVTQMWRRNAIPNLLLIPDHHHSNLKAPLCTQNFLQSSMNNVSETLPIIWAKDDDSEKFEQARIGRVFNHRRPSRTPLAVINAKSANDVIEAVQLSKSLKCKISIRSGGHSWAAWSVRDNAILIDLGGLNSINEYDDITGIVKVGPATTGEKLNGFLGTKGRMFNGGHCPTVGVGGFLYTPRMNVG